MSYTIEIKNKLKELFDNSSENCTSVGYGFKEKNGILTKEKSIIFTFKKKKPLSELSEDEIIPSYIEVDGININTDVVEGENRYTGYEACPSNFYTWLDDDPVLNPNDVIIPTNRNKIRPLKGGLKVRNRSNNFYGTMGFVAVDNDTNSLVGVTNNHVMSKIIFRADETLREFYDEFNNNMAQPTYEDEIVGKTKRYFPVVSTYVGNNYIDAALFSIDEDYMDFNESYKFEGLSFTGAPTFATTEEIDSLIDNDWDFYSSGAKTGPKGEGETKLKFLSYTNVSLLADVANNQNDGIIKKSVRYLDCITFIASASTTTSGNYCYYPIDGGDSGSALLANINGTLKIIGLVFASSEFGGYAVRAHACRIDRVSEILNISPFTGQTVNFTNKLAPLTHTVNGGSSLTGITINGLKYHQLGTFLPQ
jgi:hypothetical protein